ncbi:MAG: hypothetical protein R3E96_08745 [Planctomycetota bacterium]
METSPTFELFQRPLHPYTRACSAASPPCTPPRARTSESIPGYAPPDLANLPKGCAFAPRCAWKKERCEQQAPDAERFHDPQSGAPRTSACFELNQLAGAREVQS